MFSTNFFFCLFLVQLNAFLILVVGGSLQSNAVCDYEIPLLYLHCVPCLYISIVTYITMMLYVALNSQSIFYLYLLKSLTWFLDVSEKSQNKLSNCYLIFCVTTNAKVLSRIMKKSMK